MSIKRKLLNSVIALACMLASPASAQTIPPWWYDIDPPSWGTNVGTNYDGQRITLGNYPPSAEFANGTQNVPGALVGAISVPLGSNVTQAMGVSGYAITASSNVPAIGLYGAAMIANGAPSGKVYGSNVNVSNCGQPQCLPGTGQAFAYMVGYEADLNAMTGPGGQTSNGSVYGFIANGASDAQPGGAATAFQAWALGSSGQPTQTPWRNAFASADGGAGVGIQLGSQHAGQASDYSQAILLHSKSSAGLDQIGQIQGTPGGTILLIPAQGMVTISGTAIRITTASHPPSGSACNTGQIQWDASAIYVCEASGVWLHASLSP